MAKFVTISYQSKKIIGQLASLSDDPCLLAWDKQVSNEILQSELVCFLKQSKPHRLKTRFLLESLRASLLEDLEISLDGSLKKAREIPVSYFRNIQFQLLVMGGALLAITGGFTGITSILGVFALSTALIITTGIIFAGISLGFFYQFDRIEMSKILGTKLKKSHRLLDVCIDEVIHIGKIRKIIDANFPQIADPAHLKDCYAIVAMLDARYNNLADLRKIYLAKLANPYFNAVKRATGAVEGGLVLASGFFAGQTVALGVTSVFVAGVTVTFWPIVLCSIALSLAALGVYCVMQRPGFENRVGQLLGLDKTKIESFADENNALKQQGKLQRLAKNIADKYSAAMQLKELHKKLAGFEATKTTETPPIEDRAFYVRYNAKAHQHDFFSYSPVEIDAHTRERGDDASMDNIKTVEIEVGPTSSL